MRLAKWAFRSKEYVVQIRPADGGMVLQQLLYAEEVRSLADLDIEQVDVSDAELKLAKQLIEQISVDTYDPTEFVDEEKKRILAAVEEKIAGKQIVAPEHVGARLQRPGPRPGGGLARQPAAKADTCRADGAREERQAFHRGAQTRQAGTDEGHRGSRAAQGPRRQEMTAWAGLRERALGFAAGNAPLSSSSVG